MPRPNRGPAIRFIERRGLYYIVWYERGTERLRCTGTPDRQEAERVLLAFRGDGTLPETLAYRHEDQFVYFIGGDVGAIKIGLTIAPHKRLRSLQSGSPILLRVLATTQGARETEADYHERFAEHRLHGEWFARVPEILAEIERLCA
jgi:hypothetical protein